MWYALNRWLLQALCRWFFRYEVTGQHNELPAPFLIIANHASSIDIPLVGLAVRARVSFMSKRELAHGLLMRAWIRSLGGFFVRRGEPDRVAMAGALALLQQARAVCVFPEGTRAPDGRMLRVKTGAAYLALKTGVPVIPVAIIGAHRILPKGATWPRRGTVSVRIGSPLHVPRIQGPITHELLQAWSAKFARALMDLLPPDQHPAGATIPLTATAVRERSTTTLHESIFRSRDETLSRLEDTHFDVLIVGGGITGAAVAYAASSCGLRVALVDQGDFASGTSSRSSRLIHGGMRYLASGQVGIVWQALREQARLAEDAPHLVRPLPILVPLFDRGSVAPALLRLVWSVYHAMRPAGAKMSHSILNAGETLRREPLLNSAGLRGALLYSEFTTHDARLVLETLIAAAQHGALAANYVRLEECLVSDGRITGGVLRDQVSGRSIRLSAQVLVNASGPWSDEFRRAAGAAPPRLRLSKGVHVIIPRHRLPIAHGFNLFSPLDGRPIAVIPFGEFVQVGPTETSYAGYPGDVAAALDDVTYLLEVLNAHFPGARLMRADVIGTRAGLRPLVDQPGYTTGEVSRAYRISWDRPGLLSVLGGKLTLHRRAAMEVLRTLAAVIPGAPSRGAATNTAWRLPGALEPADGAAAIGTLTVSGISETAASYLVQTFGRRSLLLRELVAEHREWAAPLASGLSDPYALAPFCRWYEMAVTPEDFLQRRTDLALRVRATNSRLSPAVAEFWHAEADTRPIHATRR
jgi:glycerol-3-phosphate dehydrogenase